MAKEAETAGEKGAAASTDVAAATTKTLEKTAEVVNDRASTIAGAVREWLEAQSWIPSGLTHHLSILVLLAGLLLVSWIVFLVFRPIILHWIRGIVRRTVFKWDDKLFGYGVFKWATHMLPAILIHLAAPGLFQEAPLLATVLKTASSLYLLVAAFFVVDSMLNATRAIYGNTPMARRINIGTFLQVAKLIAALIAILVAIAILIGRSPAVLLGGIGVFASVLMLVFKDVILGFVAGIQLASNRMLSVGDWLEMPGHSADGNVTEIGLTTVKVRNWDKTITTIPTYALISESFKNWRGMEEAGGRRIKRSFLVDTNSIELCTEEMLQRYRQVEHITDYLQRKEKEIAEWNASHPNRGDGDRINARRLTNVGTFRAYVEAYLRNHPDVRDDLTLLVRHLDPVGQGLPIEVYCFSAKIDWPSYEGVQADIFDHLFAVAPEFDLVVYQQPTGLDIRESLSPSSLRDAADSAPDSPPSRGAEG